MIVSIDQIFFKDKPESPPSLSQWLQSRASQVIDSKGTYLTQKIEIFNVMTNFNFHYYAILIAIYQGLIIGWTGILDTILGPDDIGYSQSFVGLIGVIIFTTFILSIIGIAYINDSLRNVSFKVFIIVMTFISGMFLLVFVIVADKEVPYIDNTDLLYGIICCMLGIFFNAGTYGLSYEEGCNLLYPCREIVGGTIMTVYINIVSCIFILINSYINPYVMNWIVAGSQIVCAILLSCYRQKYDRIQLDKNQNSYHNNATSIFNNNVILNE